MCILTQIEYVYFNTAICNIVMKQLSRRPAAPPLWVTCIMHCVHTMTLWVACIYDALCTSCDARVPTRQGLPLS